MRFFMHLLHPNHLPHRRVEQVQGVYDPDWTGLYAELDVDIIRERR
jgi:hypothetical protein